jgi:hypothetical protein
MHAQNKEMEKLMANRSWKAKLNIIKNKAKMKKAEEVLKDSKELMKAIEKMTGWNINADEALEKHAERMQEILNAKKGVTELQKQAQAIVKDVNEIEESDKGEYWG